MSGRSVKCAAAALCLSALFSADPTRSPFWDWTTWTTAAWSAVTAAAEEEPPPPTPGESPDEGWLIDPNG